MVEMEQVSRIILAFAVAMIIIYITAKVVGEDKKAKWFKKRQNATFFTRRGMLGETWNFGVPCKWQGFMVALWMYGSISVIGYVLIFAM